MYELIDELHRNNHRFFMSLFDRHSTRENNRTTAADVFCVLPIAFVHTIAGARCCAFGLAKQVL